MNAWWISSWTAAVDNCVALHCSTYGFKGPKFRCIRSTPIESVSFSDKCFACFVKTGLYTLATMRQRQVSLALENDVHMYRSDVH